MSRLTVQKTLKLYVGGKFIRSESGRIMAVKSTDGSTINVARTSRKDLREAVAKARAAQAGWAARTAYNRGQILYRLAEMMDGRSMPTSATDVCRASDRAVHYAGWADKISAVLSSLNPVASTYVNYSRIRPLGVVIMAPAARDGLLGLIEAACSSAVMGNATLLLVPAELGELAAALSECLATSDLPAGVVNILTGDVGECVHVVSRHDDVDGLCLYEGSIDAERLADAQTEAARVMRRISLVGGAEQAATPVLLQRLAEVQTVWMSSYEPKGGAAVY